MTKTTMKDGYEWVDEFNCIKLVCPICHYNMSGNINMHLRVHDIHAVKTINGVGQKYLQCACGYAGKQVDTTRHYGMVWDAAWNEMYKHWADGGEEHMTMVLLSQETS